MKPHAEIRKALVEGIRNNPDKSERLKNAAEVWIAAIDHADRHGADDETEIAIQQARLRFLASAQVSSFKAYASPAEIAAAFGLQPRHQ